MPKGYVLGLVFLLIFLSGCKEASNNGQTKTTSTTTSSTTSTITSTTTSTIPPYPFENKNMFFGISQVGSSQHQAAKDLGVSWVSLEPSVFWFDIEQHIETNPGTYDWTDLDNEVKRLQLLGIDFVMLLSPIINAFTENTRTTIGSLIQSEMAEHGYDATSAFIHLMRDHDLVQTYDLSPNTPERQARRRPGQNDQHRDRPQCGRNAGRAF